MSASGGSIAIIGAGSVGSAVAYSLLLRQVVADIVLVDINHELCQAQVNDLSDATFLSNVRIRQGSVQDAQNADIIIITAGAKQKPGDTRLNLIDRNYKVLKSILQSLQPIRNDSILLIVANPVDVLTLFAQRLSGLAKNQVLGSGTLLDSIRLTRILASKLEVADTSIHAFVIGEHGDSQCVAWSTATVHGTPLLKVLPLTDNEREEIATTTRKKAEAIIKVKGFTSYGVAAVTSRICEAIIFDHRQVLPLSHWQQDLDCCLSLPAVLGRDGIISSFPLHLDEEEQSFLSESAKGLRKVIEEYKEDL
ncbi:L-lactate dehydrogenase [Mollisia scopiformis]|uniref:L-lactate dehydrogenase n=1 Tax=Mollisia scopiformis TaxID=149040 RepID=A0A132B598_MOLSC|nr:L-lactate dehydrogenase [Mollisia scopiformis]KUJ07064.1 L-lactate dehydrogenase [Mollisia scopiformis]